MVCGDSTCATVSGWVAGCLGLVGMDIKFTHSHAFILGVVWSALDIVGDVLFYLVELKPETKLAELRAAGDLDPQLLQWASFCSIISALALFLWRFRYWGELQQVGFDLTQGDDDEALMEDDEDDEGAKLGIVVVGNPLQATLGGDGGGVELSRRGASAKEAEPESELAALRRENAALRAENKALRGGGAAPPTAGGQSQEPHRLQRSDTAVARRKDKTAKAENRQELVAALVRQEKIYAVLTFFLEDLLQLLVSGYVALTTEGVDPVMAFSVGGSLVAAVLVLYRAYSMAAYALARSPQEKALRRLFKQLGGRKWRRLARQQVRRRGLRRARRRRRKCR